MCVRISTYYGTAHKEEIQKLQSENKELREMNVNISYIMFDLHTILKEVENENKSLICALKLLRADFENMRKESSQNKNAINPEMGRVTLSILYLLFDQFTWIYFQKADFLHLKSKKQMKMQMERRPPTVILRKKIGTTLIWKGGWWLVIRSPPSICYSIVRNTLYCCGNWVGTSKF